MSEDAVLPDSAGAAHAQAPEGGAVPGPVPDDAWVHGALATPSGARRGRGVSAA